MVVSGHCCRQYCDMAYINEMIFQSKVTILDIDPPIWRSLLLPPAANLAELHHVVQAAFGWLDCHLHEFIIGGLAYGAPEMAREAVTEDDARMFEATGVRLRDFDLYHVPGVRFLYHYDFGDSWLHLVEFEQLVDRDPSLNYPTCIGGARHRPPEDVGGTAGYGEFLEAWHDPAHAEHRAMRKWAGRRFQPEKFDLEATDKAVKAAYRKARGDYIFRRE